MGALLERIRADDGASYKRFESPEELERLLAEDLALLLTERFVADSRPADAHSELDPQPVARTRLPAPTTSLVGRDRERARLRALLLAPDVRLVTLTGPGGVGKTRLALAAATEIREHFEDSVCLVPLAAIADPALVPASIVQALGLRPGPGHSPLEWLTSRLGDRQLLLLLDNFEQVMAAAPDVAQLLESGSRVKALVTSREVLRLRAEYELPLAPLGLPPADAQLQPDELDRDDALRLFLERARATQPEFTLTNENIEAVAEICRRLDGIPLAIELAAARLRVFTPEAMLRRMGWRRLQLLSGGVRDLPERQQTLRGTIDWSYRLLTEPEQRLFARLSVFVGGCGFAAAEVVCNPFDDLDVLCGLESLVDKNLVQRSEVDGEEPRFSMLAMIREYAAERLDESSEADNLRRLHTNYFLAMLRNAERAMQSSLQPTWLARVERENDNVRAIMRRALRRGDPGTVGRVGSAMWLYWFTTGGTSEGRAWMEEALASPVGHDAARSSARACRRRSDGLRGGRPRRVAGDAAPSRRVVRGAGRPPWARADAGATELRVRRRRAGPRIADGQARCEHRADARDRFRVRTQSGAGGARSSGVPRTGLCNRAGAARRGAAGLGSSRRQPDGGYDHGQSRLDCRPHGRARARPGSLPGGRSACSQASARKAGPHSPWKAWPSPRQPAVPQRARLPCWRRPTRCARQRVRQPGQPSGWRSTAS